MTERFIQFHLFLARWRTLVLLLLAVFGVMAMFTMHRLRLSDDFTDVLPMSAPAIAGQVQALKHIRQADRIYIDVATATPDGERLEEAAAKMTARLRDLPQLTEVRGEINLADLGAAYQELQAQLPWMLDSNDLRALEPQLAPAALERRLAWLKQAMMEPQGMMYKTVAQTDPAGLGDTVALRLRTLQAGAGDARIVGGRITSSDGCHVLINATPQFPSSAAGKSAGLIAAVLHAARSVESEFPTGMVKISVTGAHRAALDNAAMIRADSTRTSVIATLAIAGLIILACRRRWLALLALLPVVFGALGAGVVFYLTGDLVSSVALGCGSMLIGVTVDYGIFIVYQLDNAPPATRAELARRVAGLVPALAFGALTTMAAFLVMFLSPVSGHRQLGLFGVAGVGLAALFAIFILPVFIPVKAQGDARPLPLTRLMGHVFAWCRGNERYVWPVLALCTLACALGVGRVRFDGDLARLNGETPDTHRDESVIRNTWGKSLSLTTIVVGGTNREEALQKNEQVRAALEKLSGQNLYESYASVAQILPSARTRAAHERAWRDFWTNERQAELRAALADAAAKLGFRMEAFAPYLKTLAAPVSPEGPETDAALKRLTADFQGEFADGFYLTTLVKVPDTKAFSRLQSAVQAAVPDAMMLNKSVLSDEITQIARRALPKFGLLVAALNALLIFLLLGRVELVLVTLLPMAAGMLWTLGTLGLCGLPVDVANFVFVIFIVGVGGDYSLFLVLGELEPLRGHPERTAATGAAVAMCALTALLGTGVLVLAHHPALFSVGLTALLGISYSLLATLFLLPMSLRWLVRFNTPRRESLLTPAQRQRAVHRLYRFQGPYVSQFAYWKMKTDPLFRAVENAAPARGEILDLGCGFGLVAHWLTLGGSERRVLGLDFDADKIRVAQATARANPQTSFAQGDLLTGPEYPACDCVLLCDVLHYFPRELKTGVLRKAFAALRPAGCLILRDACAEATSGHRIVAWAERWAVRLGQNRTRHGLHFEDERTHVALLREAGFAKVEVRGGSGLGSNLLLIATKAGFPTT